MKRTKVPARGKVTPSQLLSEEVVSLGRVGAMCFVETDAKIHLIHVHDLGAREIDAYLISQVQRLLEHGFPLVEVAFRLEIPMGTISKALSAVGYVRPALNDRGPRAGAHARRQAGENERGRRVRDFLATG